MTLILSCATRDFAIQVSDRRLTAQLPGGGLEIRDNQFNKAVVVRDSLVFGYSGLAGIEKQDTSAWLASVLAHCTGVADSCSVLATKATTTFAKLRHTAREKRHAFVGVGWRTHVGGRAKSAVICTVSNALNERGGWRREAEGEFAVRVHDLKRPGRFVFVDVGCGLTHPQRDAIEKTLRVCTRRKAGPGAVAQHLAQAVLSIAANNETVGSNLMVVCIPKVAVRGDGTVGIILQRRHQVGALHLLSRQPRGSDISFISVPANGVDTKDFSPRFAGPASFANFRVDETPTAPAIPKSHS